MFGCTVHTSRCLFAIDGIIKLWGTVFFKGANDSEYHCQFSKVLFISTANFIFWIVVHEVAITFRVIHGTRLFVYLIRDAFILTFCAYNAVIYFYFTRYVYFVCFLIMLQLSGCHVVSTTLLGNYYALPYIHTSYIHTSIDKHVILLNIVSLQSHTIKRGIECGRIAHLYAFRDLSIVGSCCNLVLLLLFHFLMHRLITQVHIQTRSDLLANWVFMMDCRKNAAFLNLLMFIIILQGLLTYWNSRSLYFSHSMDI